MKGQIFTAKEMNKTVAYHFSMVEDLELEKHMLCLLRHTSFDFLNTPQGTPAEARIFLLLPGGEPRVTRFIGVLTFLPAAPSVERYNLTEQEVRDLCLAYLRSYLRMLTKKLP